MTIPPARSARTGVLPTLILALATITALGVPSFASPSVAAAPAAAEVVGVLRVEAPASSSFLLRGTLPLPRGTWTTPGTTEPLVILDHDGNAVATQCEVVSRYPSSQDGVDVVEVRGRVTRPPSKKAGDDLTYKVAYQPHPVSGDPGASVAALKTVSSLPANLKALLSNPYGMVIEARDVFGNSYLALPLMGLGKKTLLKHGPVTSQLRVATTLVPAPPVSGPQGTLPHHLGVIAYLTTNAKDASLEIDLRFHNAHSGLDPNDPLDDPLGDVYFESINIYVPQGWFFVQDFLDPYLSLPAAVSYGYRVFPLVAPSSDGLHGMKWQAQFHRRLVLVPDEEIVGAQSKLRGAGLGFATRGVSSTSGKALWSWWNPLTARWFPQSHLLPSLDHVNKAELDATLKQQREKLEQSLAAGTATGAYPLFAPVLGHAHPYGTKYGGMTSGVEIHITDGIQILERASLDGYCSTRMTMRMTADRMPNLLINADGKPTSVSDWVVTYPDGNSYVPFECFNTPKITPVDPFGLHKAPTFQADYVETNQLASPDSEELQEYFSIDFQHLVRYTRLMKILAWLENDSLSKDELQAQAEVFHLSYHPHANSPGMYVQSTGLRADLDHITVSGPVGFSFGRGEGWGLDCAVAAYATAPPAWRTEHRTWLDTIADALAEGQSTCTGFIQSTVSEKFFSGGYRARQMIEQSIIENAVLGLIETVYRGKDSGKTSSLETVLKKSAYSMLDPMAWEPGQNEPWAYSAVGPLGVGQPPYCDLSEVEGPGHASYTDAFQNWSSFAYGFELTGDPVFLQFAQLQIGGDLVGYLLSAGVDNVENRSALLALIQKALGMI